jgi:AcrR family transcriptional regulator
MTTSELRGPLIEASLDARNRLLAALDRRLRAGCSTELHDVTIEALADHATVSRATAYRYFGNRTRLRAHAAELLVVRYAPEAAKAAAAAPTAAAKVSAAMTYWARRVSEVDLLREALALGDDAPVGRRLRQALAELLEPVLRSGQADGQFRSDLELAEMLTWAIEQQLALLRQGLKEHDAHRWVECFVVPAVRAVPAGGPVPAVVEQCLRELHGQLAVLDELTARAQAIADGRA